MKSTEVTQGDRYLGGHNVARVRKNTLQSMGVMDLNVNLDIHARFHHYSNYKTCAKFEPLRKKRTER
jgi:hypothetical protein